MYDFRIGFNVFQGSAVIALCRMHTHAHFHYNSFPSFSSSTNHNDIFVVKYTILLIVNIFKIVRLIVQCNTMNILTGL